MKMHALLHGALAFALAASASAAIPLPAPAGSVPIGGTGGWDYVAVDPASHQVYVSHETRMHVVDPAQGKVVAEIPGLAGVHGIALVPACGRGFITCGKSDTLAVLDLKTHQILARLKTGAKPDGVVYDPFSGRVFVSDNDGASLTVVDARTQKVLGTVALGGAPESAQPDLAGRLYVNLEDRNQVAVVDTTTLKVVATWPLAPHATPTGMAIDPKGGHLFVGCRSRQLVVLDLATGGIAAALPIGAGVDACAFDPATRRVFASCKDGSLAVAEADGSGHFTLAGSLVTEPGAKTMTLDPGTHRLFVPAPGASGPGFRLLEFDQPGVQVPGEKVASEDGQVRDFHPIDLGLADVKLYRSASPVRALVKGVAGAPTPAVQAQAQAILAHLKALGIITIICLEDPQDSDQADKPNASFELERSAAQAAGITFHSHPMRNERLKDMDPQAIEAWIDGVEKDAFASAAKGGVLIHCAAGHDRTGLVAAHLRITVAKWPVARATQEMRDLGHNWVKYSTDGGVSSWHEAFLEHRFDAPAPR